MPISSASSPDRTGGRYRVCLTMLDPAGRGGVYRLTSEMYGALVRWGWAPSLIYLSNSPEDGLFPRQLLRKGKFAAVRTKVNRGMQGLAFGHLPASLHALGYFWPYSGIRRYLSQFDFHVVIGGAERGITLAVFGIPYICWVATTLDDEIPARADLGDPWAQALLTSPQWPLLRWTEQFVLRRARRILAISPHTADAIRRLTPDLTMRIDIVPCPVDTDLFRPEEAVGRNHDGSVLLFVGRAADARKNVAMLLQAMKQVHVAAPSARLRIISSSSPTLEALVEDLELRQVVEFIPHVKYDSDLARCYRDAQLFVLPSRQEGLAIVVQEAMASGLPVVSTRCGGPEFIISDGRTGRLVPTNAPGSFAEAVLELLRSPERRQEMGRAGRHVAVRIFSRSVVERQFREAFGAAFGIEVDQA